MVKKTEEKKKKSAGFSIDDIDRKAGLQGIRSTPGPYIGPADQSGLWVIIRELLDNVVDISLKGMNNFGQLIIDKEPNTYWVLDHGPGIPIEKKEIEDERGRKEKLSGLLIVTGLTHAGSNFKGEHTSRGVHGLGIKCSNALSTFFKFWTHWKGQWYSIEYSKGRLIADVKKDKPPKLPFGIKVKNAGTIACIKPDLSLFDKGVKSPDKDQIKQWFTLSSYLVPKLKLVYTSAKGKSTEYQTKNGMADYLTDRIKETDAKVFGKFFVFNNAEIDVALAFTSVDGEQISAYTNGLSNKEGGEQVKALEDALVKSLQEYKGKFEFTPTNLREGLLGLVNAKLAAPKFNNQPKDKLVDSRIYPLAYKSLLTAFTDFWKKNKALAKDLCKRASEFKKLNDKFKASKDFINKVKKASNKQSAKLAAIVGNAPLESREIFLVEGDSAAGGAKEARDRTTQAVFPLKGKPLNVWKAKPDKINNNTEIIGLLAALGVDLNSKTVSCNYGKIIIMADADVDGAHITVLLMGLFWKFTPDLIKQGRIYVLQAPLYRCKVGETAYYGDDKKALLKKYGVKADITYLKGLGEMDPEDLGEQCFDATNRKLFKVKYPKSQEEIKNFESMIGEDVAYRKAILNISREAA